MADYYSAYQNGQRIRMNVTNSQDVANNRSYVRTIHIQEVASGFVADAKWRCMTQMGGTSYYDVTAYRDIRSTVTISDTARYVSHAADGTGSVYCYVYSWTGATVYFRQTVGATIILPTIPRATTPTWSGNFIPGEEKTINLPRASSTFTHDVSFTFGSVSGTIGTGLATEVPWTPDLSLLNEMTTSATSGGTITTVTKSGTTTIGTKTTPFTMEAGSDIVPVVTSVTWEDSNTTTKDNIGALVQDVSRPVVSVAANGVYGSTIESRSITIAGNPRPVGTAFTIRGSGSLPLVATAVDSRGRSGTLTTTIDSLPYTPPSASLLEVFRSDDTSNPVGQGEYLSVRLNASVASLTVSGTEKNDMTIVVSTKATNAPGEFTQRNSFSGGLAYDSTFLVGGGNIYAQATSFDVEVKLTDKAGVTVTFVVTVTVATVTLDLVGNAVGIGKLWEDGTLDVGGDTYIRGDVFADGNVEIGGDSHIDGTAFIDTGVQILRGGSYKAPLLNAPRTIVFESSGTFYKGDYPNAVALVVKVVGGGGSGGGGSATGSVINSFGQGGGGGGYAQSTFTDISAIPASVTVTVGAGGAGVVASSAGGGTSRFGDISTAPVFVEASGGGGGGVKPANTYPAYVPGGVAGQGLHGDLLIGGAGGGCGSGNASLCASGSGGNSYMGGGGGSTGTGAGSGRSTGVAGSNYGGGGGGGAVNSNASAGVAGGAGADGVVIVEVYE